MSNRHVKTEKTTKINQKSIELASKKETRHLKSLNIEFFKVCFYQFCLLTKLPTLITISLSKLMTFKNYSKLVFLIYASITSYLLVAEKINTTVARKFVYVLWKIR